MRSSSSPKKMVPAGSRGLVGVGHFQPDTLADRGHSFRPFSQWIWVTCLSSDSAFLSWHLKIHLKHLLFLSLCGDEEEGDREMKLFFDIILSFLQSFSITQSFILFHFPRTITCRQLMEVQNTVVKSTGSWARQASSSSSKTILLKTLKIEKKKTEKFGNFLPPFGDWSHWSSPVWQSCLIWLVDSVELGLLHLLPCSVSHSHWFVLSGEWMQLQPHHDCRFKGGRLLLVCKGKLGVCLSSHLTDILCTSSSLRPRSVCPARLPPYLRRSCEFFLDYSKLRTSHDSFKFLTYIQTYT